jgi:DNA-binding MarR family transcriptional regulator
MARLTQSKPQRLRRTSQKRRSKKVVRMAVDYVALAEFRHELRIFLAFSETNARREGLTSQQYQALLTIKGFGREKTMFVGELARLLLIKHHTAGELIARMEQLGLLKRNVDVNDNRRVLVTLTRKGMLRLEKVAAVNFKHLGTASRTFSRVLKLISQPPNG